MAARACIEADEPPAARLDLDDQLPARTDLDRTNRRLKAVDARRPCARARRWYAERDPVDGDGAVRGLEGPACERRTLQTTTTHDTMEAWKRSKIKHGFR